jgi:hypothetical protein
VGFQGSRDAGKVWDRCSLLAKQYMREEERDMMSACMLTMALHEME